MKGLKKIFKIDGNEIDFSAVRLDRLTGKILSLLRGRTKKGVEDTVCASLKKYWNEIENGNKEFDCYKEEKDGVLSPPQHVKAGQGIPFYPCVFILKCNLFMAGGKEIHLRIKIDETGDIYNVSAYGVTYKYKVSDLFVCDEYGNPLTKKNDTANVKVAHARDAANKKPVLKSINAGEDIPQDTPTYSLGANVGGEIMAARQMLNNEQHQTEPDNMPMDTTQGRNDDVDVESFAPIKKDVTDAPSQIGDRQQRENSCDDGWDGEMAFLSAFDGYVKACGFKYEPADLVRLHTSVKCSMCTLLAGSPGTGKSSLAELYMRAVAGSPEKNDAERSWRQIFVNPAWMEPADLLGYETGSGFQHAPSHLAEFIRNISEGENLPMGIVCFEEMNLACVEHYFSDFIQIMSRGMGEIPGCKENGRDLFVGHNFRVIGTCNSDETTRPLSPRFLSRCNTIELSSSFETTKLLVEDIAKGNAPEIKPFSGNAPITYKDFEHWFESSYARTIDDGIVSAILSLLEPKEEDESIMSSAGFDMSGRIISDLFAYIRSRPPYTGKISDNREASRLSEIDRQKVALDEFLAQRVFFACRPTPGTITAISKLRDMVNNGFRIEVSSKGDQNVNPDLLKLPLSAELLKRRIDDYNKRIMQV